MAAVTYGRRSLLALLQRTSAREVAARCDVVPSCVSEWASGEAQPSPEAQTRLMVIYGISSYAWTIELRFRTSAPRRMS